MVLVAIAVIVAWMVDARSHDGLVPRNVEFAGVALGGADAGRVRTIVTDFSDGVTRAPVEVLAGETVVATDAASLGITLNIEATVESIVGIDHDVVAPVRLVRWLSRLANPHQVKAEITLDPEISERGMDQVALSVNSEATYPTIEVRDGSYVAIEGAAGRRLDTESLLTGLEASVGAGAAAGLRIDVEVETVPPLLTGALLDNYIEQLNAVTAAPMQVLAAGVTHDAPSDLLRQWLTIVAPDDLASPPLTGIDQGAVMEWLRSTFEAQGTPVDLGQIQVIDGQPTIPGSTVSVCCTDDAPQQILTAVLSNAGRAELTMADTDGNVLEAFGIVEVVGEFTTYHPAGQDRVTNIQRMADIVRGAIIQPGATFSINDHVGRRTPELGFVPAGVIYRGVLDEDVGGGVSQFATTIFNAAFFAGLEFDEYMAHSLYFDRYPYGREATISFPAPDLVISNPSPYPVLVWPSYTSDSITVQLFSTRWAQVIESASWTEPVGACTKAVTERTRTLPDGSSIVDTVQALYQPKEGLDCAGLPTLPIPECAPGQEAFDSNDTGFPDDCRPLPAGALGTGVIEPLPGGGQIGCDPGRIPVDTDGNGAIDGCQVVVAPQNANPCAPRIGVDTTGDGVIDTCGDPVAQIQAQAQAQPDTVGQG